MDSIMQFSANSPKVREANEILQCNGLTSKFGLTLSESQARSLVEKRFEALKNTGRIEFGEGILKKLIVEFCDSPYISQDDYEETIIALQEIFYYFKSDSLDILSDDELLQAMKKSFDGECEGSLEYLKETTMEELCRNARFRR